MQGNNSQFILDNRCFICVRVTLRDPLKKNDVQLIDDDIWRPELLHRERNPGDAVTFIRVPHQELIVPVLQ